MVTPFTATTKFSSKNKVDSVKVTDENGPHEIPVTR